MIRGTTPVHIFTLPFDTGEIKSIRVIYSQRSAVRLKKENPDVTLSGAKATVKLSQEDTLGFNAELPVDIQIRILTNSGDALASNIISVPCRKILDNEVLQ